MKKRPLIKNLHLVLSQFLKIRAVFLRILNISKSLRNAVLLMGIYALHLVFLQVLMTEAPVNKSDNSFRPLFTHTSKGPITTPNHHPAVSYYTQLIKQGTLSGRAQSEAPQIISNIAAFLFPAPNPAIIEFSAPSVIPFQLADDLYKRYSFFQVFLI
jgi:hypothetical protein